MEADEEFITQRWFGEFSNTADAEGWNIFDCGGYKERWQIQRLVGFGSLEGD